MAITFQSPGGGDGRGRVEYAHHHRAFVRDGVIQPPGIAPIRVRVRVRVVRDGVIRPPGIAPPMLRLVIRCR